MGVTIYIRGEKLPAALAPLFGENTYQFVQNTNRVLYGRSIIRPLAWFYETSEELHLNLKKVHYKKPSRAKQPGFFYFDFARKSKRDKFFALPHHMKNTVYSLVEVFNNRYPEYASNIIVHVDKYLDWEVRVTMSISPYRLYQLGLGPDPRDP